MLAEARAGRETATFRLPPSRLDVEPGDVLALAGASWRVARIADGPSRLVTAVRAEDQIHLSAPRPAKGRTRTPPGLAGPPAAIVLDLASAESEPVALQRIAVSADPWPGGYTLWRSADGESFEPDSTVATRAMIGTTTAPLPAGPLWRMDRRAALDIVLSHGQLQSVGETASLGGVNLVAVELAAQGWEILTYATAALTGADSWRLTGLTRGLQGSEPLASLAKPAGSRVVILDGAVQAMAGMELLGQRMFWRLSPAGRDHADAMAIAFETTPGPAALLPLAPARLKARRQAGGVVVSWIRRTRAGGDAWEPVEVPLGEEFEGYLVEVLDGGAVKRSAETTSPGWTYAAAEEAADFGGQQAALRFRVRQISRAAGPGQPAEALLAVA
jgi:hypothetical protein